MGGGTGRIAFILLALLLCAATAWAEVWGSSKSKAYHYKLCRWMGQVKPEYRLSFATPLEARKAGYQPCGTCRPPGVEPGEKGRKIRKS
ncbi:MAG TPA: hypothetical protein VFF53_05810 [Geobacteraceae bacterium]|nr:hypothetical protein [Geobacteraceae bacterium]